MTSIFVLSVVFAFGCQRSSGPLPAELNYRLKWVYNTSVVGDLYADVHGIFKRYGLHVNVKAGGPERDAIKELELGHAHFGTASADQVIRALSKGSPLVVVAQLFRVNPLQWIYRPDQTVFETPLDLKGRTIGVTFGGNDETIMRALLAKYGISEQDVSLFSVRYDYSPFYEGTVDFWPVYRNAQGIIIGQKLEAAGEVIRFLDPNDLGIRFVANSVITTQQMFEKHPDTVRRFVSALLEGWENAIEADDIRQSIETIHRFDKDTPLDVIREQFRITRKMIKPSNNMAIGDIDIDAWKQTEQIMVTQKLIPKPVNVERVLKTVEIRHRK